MDPLNETSYIPQLSSLLLWIKVIEVCTGALFALALLTLLAMSVRQLSWRVRLSALVPLAAGIAAGIVAHALHTTYVYWENVLSLPEPTPGHITVLLIKTHLVRYQHIQREVASATHTATILGWGVVVVVTGILLILGFLGAWRLVATGRHRQLPTS